MGVSRQVRLLMLGHPVGAKKMVIGTMMANKKTNHGVLEGKHLGEPRGPGTIVGRGGMPANFR